MLQNVRVIYIRLVSTQYLRCYVLKNYSLGLLFFITLQDKITIYNDFITA